MSWRQAALTVVVGILAVHPLSAQVLGQGFWHDHALPMYDPLPVPLPYLHFTPLPAFHRGYLYTPHAHPYIQNHLWTLPHIGYPVIRERVIIREYIHDGRPYRHRFPRIDFWLLALTNGLIYAVKDYWLEEETLHYTKRDGTRSSVPLEDVDLTFTKRLNRRIGTPFRLRNK